MVLDPGNMEGDQLFQIQAYLALTMWMLLYEVVSCFDEDDSVLLEPLIASYLVRILVHYSVLKTIFKSLTHLSFSLSFIIRSAYTLDMCTYSIS